MREIEARLHDMLLEIAPGLYDEEEQARIIAEASALFGRFERRAATRSSDMVRESQMMDSILQAIGQLPEWDEEPEYIDGRGMTPEQIVRAAARGGGYKPDMGLEILNDSDLDVFYGEPDHQDPHGYTMEDVAEYKDGEDAHPDTYFFTPGRGRHRSDSQSRGGHE